MKRLMAVVAGLLMVLSASAATNNAVVAWTWPTNDVAGNAISGPLSGVVFTYVYDGIGVQVASFPVSREGYPTNTTLDIYAPPGTCWITVAAINSFGDEGATATAIRADRYAPAAPVVNSVAGKTQ